MTEKISPKTKNWRKLLADEWRWFRKHGASVEAYVQRYKSQTDPLKYGEGGEPIFEADLEALKRKLKIVSDMAQSRRWKPKMFVLDNGKAVRAL